MTHFILFAFFVLVLDAFFGNEQDSNDQASKAVKAAFDVYPDCEANPECETDYLTGLSVSTTDQVQPYQSVNASFNARSV
ncbi:hypothetical protein [Stenomitos frigidus]|uniref:Uncharacterized protein n=1 Tax=Stenomitos frigidus ULC18 TaxID=2107698 RepID=A0A2T1E764_9CYAN|nr:hypothetical protein [Stenomitos frigidus]PSB28573.1 hypothetical protein C7B82_13140 [Stenomitos frigidus ULC18]